VPSFESSTEKFQGLDAPIPEPQLLLVSEPVTENVPSDVPGSFELDEHVNPAVARIAQIAECMV
jgi:hypothetical protein